MIDEQSSYAFLRSRPPGDGDTASPEYQIHRNASPVTHVSADSPPALLMHGSNDEIVAYNQSVTMLEVLQSAGVTSELLTIPGGGHGARFSGAQEPVPDYVGRSIAWIDTHLKD